MNRGTGPNSEPTSQKGQARAAWRSITKKKEEHDVKCGSECSRFHMQSSRALASCGNFFGWRMARSGRVIAIKHRAQTTFCERLGHHRSNFSPQYHVDKLDSTPADQVPTSALSQLHSTSFPPVYYTNKASALNFAFRFFIRVQSL